MELGHEFTDTKVAADIEVVLDEVKAWLTRIGMLYRIWFIGNSVKDLGKYLFGIPRTLHLLDLFGIEGLHKLSEFLEILHCFSFKSKVSAALVSWMVVFTRGTR
jgi:hypothetical protein